MVVDRAPRSQAREVEEGEAHHHEVPENRWKAIFAKEDSRLLAATIGLSTGLVGNHGGSLSLASGRRGAFNCAPSVANKL